MKTLGVPLGIAIFKHIYVADKQLCKLYNMIKW